jgi:hypothetical protein
MDFRHHFPLTDLTALDLNAKGAEVIEWQGHSCLRLTDGLALVPFTALDYSLEVWVGADEGCYPGLAFRAEDKNNHEMFYAQPHTSGKWDALQYDPLFNGSNTWQIYHGEAYQGATDVPTGRWFHLRVDVCGTRAAVSVDGQPPLVVEHLAHHPREGRVGVWTYRPAYFRDLTITPCNGIHSQGVQPSAPRGVLEEVLLTLVAPAPTAPMAKAGVTHERLLPEPNGVFNLNRWISTPSPEAYLEYHFTLDSDQDQLFRFGFSDEMRLELDGAVVFRGKNTYQGMDRDLDERGYIQPTQYEIETELSAGEHVIKIACGNTEPFGWGFILCRQP